jgi:hypothetical protein
LKYLKSLAELVAGEPAVAIGVTTAALVLLANYGLPVGGQHAQDIKDLLSAGLILLGAYVTRTQVSPAAAPAAPAAPTAPAPPVAPPAA